MQANARETSEELQLHDVAAHYLKLAPSSNEGNSNHFRKFFTPGFLHMLLSPQSTNQMKYRLSHMNNHFFYSIFQAVDQSGS